ncbi:MAG: protein kinase [Anaerolineales bacterium]|nr:protein kinase [Anaerolineales bacterium]
MDNLPPGLTLGAYRIISQIGQGGMASVYKAYQPAMDRYVALKVLPRNLAASREFTGRFEHEARLIARLEHAHILPVHDYGTADGYTYLAMRYVEAGTLKDRLQAGPLTPAEIDRYFTQLADALDYAHGLGIIHRDLKPSNALLDKRGNLFLTDFGIAKLLEGSPEFTSTGAMVGTPAYMSPEQAQGHRVDLRTDIYSLGIVLFEMVTGRVPFEADTPLAVILKHLNAPLPLPSSLKPDVPPDVERVLLKALTKDRDERFATTADFIAAWQQARPAFLNRPAPAAPPPPTATVPRPLPAAPTAAEPLPAAPAPPTVAPPPAAPPPAAVSPSVTPLPAPAPRPESRARWGLLGLAAGAVVLLAAVLACGALAWALINGPLANLGAPPAPTEDPGRPQPTAGPGGEAPAGWQSWAAANTIWAVAVSVEGQLITGGPGSVVGWDMSTGEADTQFNGANGLPSPEVYALLSDPDHGLFWIGTADGLVATDGQSLTYYRQENGLDTNVIFALAQTSYGLLAGLAYSGEDGAGLDIYTDDAWQRFPEFPSVSDETDPDHLSTTVLAIVEDPDSGLWVSTTNGLGRYDGQSWTRYTLDDGLPQTGLRSLAVINGELWAGADNGVVRFNGEGFEFVPGLEGWSVNSLLATSTGEVWASLGDGLAHRAFDAEEWVFLDPADLPAYGIYRGVEGPDGALYFGTDAGVLRLNGQERTVWSAANLPSAAAYGAIRLGPQPGQLWFIEAYGTRTDVFDLTAGAWQPGPTLNCDYCAPLAQDAQGRWWAGGDLGAWLFDAGGDTVVHLTAADGLPADGVYSAAIAPDGAAFLATYAGVAVYQDGAIVDIYTADRVGLAGDAVHAVWTTSDGALWVAAEHGVSRRGNDGEWQHFDAGDPFESQVWVEDVTEAPDGAVWIATSGEGVYRYADGAWSNYRADDPAVGLPTNEVHCITAAPDGSLWFGLNYSGAVRFDGENWQAFNVGDGLIHSNVNDLVITDDGAVWFATTGGVSRYQP